MDFRPSCAHPAAADWRRSWLDAYPCERDGTLPYPRAPLTVLLEHAVRRYPGRTACTLYGQRLSYAQLDRQAHRLAGALRQMGAGPGRFVGVLLPNVPEHAVTLQAIWLTGASVLQLSPLMVAEEVSHWLEATGCHIVVTLDLLAPLVSGSLQRGPVEHMILTTLRDRVPLWKGMLYRIEHYRRNHTLRLREDAHRHHWDHVLQAAPLERPAVVRPEEDIALLVPTGGTTGQSKAVMLTHRNLIANAFQVRDRTGGPDGAEGTLAVLPFFHAFGLSVVLLGAWVKGGTVHMMPRFEARSALHLIERERIELLALVPAMAGGLISELQRRPTDLSFVRGIVTGASAMPAELRRALQRLGITDVVEGYGLSEASPVTHVNLMGEANRPGTIGLPVADTEARVVDSTDGTTEVPTGQPGELIVRGPQVMKGYYNNPVASRTALRDGWLYTGDIVTRCRDGYFTVVDRKKDIIKTNGFLVFPAEVEEVIARFPGVAEAAVVGVPDRDRGELIRALVVPRNGHLDLSALERYCGEHLGKHKRPRQIEVVPELPKNFLGKVLRRKLREPA
jgi:long-chain acyl-CoA synthetase